MPSFPLYGALCTVDDLRLAMPTAVGNGLLALAAHATGRPVDTLPLALAAHTAELLAATLADVWSGGWTYCVLAICWRMCGVTAVLQLRLVVVCAVSAGRRGRATSCRAGQAGWLGGLRPTAGHPRPRGFTLPTLRLHTGRGPSPGPPSAPRQPLASLVVVPAAPVHCHRGAGAGRAVRGTGLRDTGHLRSRSGYLIAS